MLRLIYGQEVYTKDLWIMRAVLTVSDSPYLGWWLQLSCFKCWMTGVEVTEDKDSPTGNWYNRICVCNRHLQRGIWVCNIFFLSTAQEDCKFSQLTFVKFPESLFINARAYYYILMYMYLYICHYYFLFKLFLIIFKFQTTKLQINFLDNWVEKSEFE
jgi:hypothetical protein